MWYDGVYDSVNNRWTATVDIADHNIETGEYSIEVHGIVNSENNFLIGQTTVNVNEIERGEVSLSDISLENTGEEYIDNLVGELDGQLQYTTNTDGSIEALVTIDNISKLYSEEEGNCRIVNDKIVVDTYEFEQTFTTDEDIKNELIALNPGGYIGIAGIAYDDTGIAVAVMADSSKMVATLETNQTLEAPIIGKSTIPNYSLSAAVNSVNNLASCVIQVASKPEQSENVRSIQKVLQELKCWVKDDKGTRSNEMASGRFTVVTGLSLERFQMKYMNRKGNDIIKNKCDLAMTKKLSQYYILFFKSEVAEDAAIISAKDYLTRLNYNEHYNLKDKNGNYNGKWSTDFDNAINRFLFEYGLSSSYINSKFNKSSLFNWLQQAANGVIKKQGTTGKFDIYSKPKLWMTNPILIMNLYDLKTEISKTSGIIFTMMKPEQKAIIFEVLNMNESVPIQTVSDQFSAIRLKYNIPEPSSPILINATTMDGLIKREIDKEGTQTWKVRIPFYISSTKDKVLKSKKGYLNFSNLTIEERKAIQYCLRVRLTGVFDKETQDRFEDFKTVYGIPDVVSHKWDINSELINALYDRCLNNLEYDYDNPNLTAVTQFLKDYHVDELFYGSVVVWAGSLSTAVAEATGDIVRFASGARKSALNILSDEEITFIKNEFAAIGGNPDKLVFNTGGGTCYVDEIDKIFVRGDIFPIEDAAHPRSNMSPRAVLAHEYYGHAANSGTPIPPGMWNDEFRASYMAAKDAPNLTDLDRYNLIQDAITRAQEAGVTIELNDFMRSILYGY